MYNKVNEICCGDCLELMKEIPDNYFDSFVTDPPYGLKFMGKDWDHGVPGEHFWKEFLRTAKPGAHLMAFGGTRTHHRLMVAIEDAGWEIRDTLGWLYGSGFPKSLDVSKAIDKSAGVEREVVGRKPDPRYNSPATETSGAPMGNLDPRPNSIKNYTNAGNITLPATDAAKQWSGWGTALKPAYEIIILARKPLEGTVAENVLKWGCGGINVDGCRVEYLSESDKASATPQGSCTAKVGALAGGVQCDTERTTFARPEQKGRFPANLIHDGSDEVLALFPDSKGQCGDLRAGIKQHPHNCYGDYGQTTGMLKRGDSGSAARFFKVCSYEDSDALLCSAKTKYINDILSVCDQNLVNTVDDNSTLSSQHAVSVLNRVVIEASQEGNQLKNIVGLSTSVTPLLLKHLCENAIELIVNSEQECLQGLYPIGMVKLNGNLARYAGIQRQTDTTTIIQNPTNLDGCAAVVMSITTKNNMALGEVGYLPRFKYCAKASKSERGFGNTHPTVKPLALMQYLVRLITPPNGIICDPFIGSGSTAIAAIKEGFNYVGMDEDQSSVDIANKRIFDNL
jgi:DNA modification methylase